MVDPEDTSFTVRPLTTKDRLWVNETISHYWKSPLVVVHGKTYNTLELPGFIAETKLKKLGLLTYLIEGASCEIVTLNSFYESKGIGTTLIQAVKEKAKTEGCIRLWLVTTNDNLHALGFYQRKGFELVKIHKGAVEKSRKIKPEIPKTGYQDIPILDEIEMELTL